MTMTTRFNLLSRTAHETPKQYGSRASEAMDTFISLHDKHEEFNSATLIILKGKNHDTLVVSRRDMK